jgi:hypothetical protein
MNAIMNCASDPVLLEDPNIMFQITAVKDQKDFSEDQIEEVAEMLNEAHGVTSS